MRSTRTYLLLNVPLVFLILAGCSPQSRFQLTASPVPSLTSFPIPSASPTDLYTSTPTPQPTQKSSPTPIAAICSPLRNIPLTDLTAIVSNPFTEPPPGQDGGHHGIDFAFYEYKDQGSIKDWPVQAVFPGEVAAAIHDRPPYGNFIIVETSLTMLPADIKELVEKRKPTSGPTPVTPLSCPPDIENPIQWSSDESLYLLYAHMGKVTDLKIGDELACGSSIGFVGNTGLSGNPHLHLEARVGPAGNRFTEMAHYTASASAVEMANYCAWRISGWFRMFDPMELLNQP